MIERLKESGGRAVGFKVTGKVTADEVKAFEPQVEAAIRELGKRPIGVLADLSEMKSADWKARWEEIRFLAKHAEHIARVAVVGAHKWEDVKAEILAGTVLIQSETRYYPSAEILHAWHWVKTGDHPNEIPVRRIFPREGLMGDYSAEYSEV